MAVRRGTGEKRVGHTGTLDPLATGLLILCLGTATRLSEYLVHKDKRYVAHVRLGQSTNTYDASGQVTMASETLPEREAVEAALVKFRGPLQQTPPAFSAIKRAGQKAYQLARNGQAVELEPRPVEIFALELVEWKPPDCALEVSCSAGTYIRSLAHDLGQTLGCGAHLAALRRTASGHFTVNEAVALLDLQAAFAAGGAAWQPYLRPVESAVPDWPQIDLTAENSARIQHGQTIPIEAAAQVSDLARAYDPAGAFIAVLQADARAGVWRPHKVLVSTETEPNSDS
jgi:tRNA pseudouridine55 synthase